MSRLKKRMRMLTRHAESIRHVEAAASITPATEREHLVKALGTARISHIGEVRQLSDLEAERDEAREERDLSNKIRPEHSRVRKTREQEAFEESNKKVERQKVRVEQSLNFLESARKELREYDAKQFPENLSKANKAVGAAAFVVASLIVQLANGDYGQPWFIWGMRWSLCGIAAIVAFYLVRGGVSYIDWRRRKWSADELESFGIRDWIIRVELAVFLLQLAFLFLAAWQVIVGLNLLPGWLTT